MSKTNSGHQITPRLPSRYEDLDESFRGKLLPNRALIELVQRGIASIKVSRGVRFVPVFGDSGSGKSSATLQLATHLDRVDVVKLSERALSDRDQLEREIFYDGMMPRINPVIAVVDQFEETATEKSAIPSNFVEKISLIDRENPPIQVIFLWLTTSRSFQSQLSDATSRNTRILLDRTFTITGPDRTEWPSIIADTFLFHNDGRDLADYQILDSDISDSAKTEVTLGTSITRIGELLAQNISRPMDLSQFRVVMLWPVTDGIRIETLNRFSFSRQGYRLNWAAFINHLNKNDRDQLPLGALNKARLYFDLRLVPIAAADLKIVCGRMDNPKFSVSKSSLKRFKSTHFYSMVSPDGQSETFTTLRERDSTRREQAEAWYAGVTTRPTEIGKSIADALILCGLQAGHERTYSSSNSNVRADVWVEQDSAPKTTIVELKAFSPANTRPSGISDAIRVTLTRHAQFAGFLARQ